MNKKTQIIQIVIIVVLVAALGIGTYLYLSAGKELKDKGEYFSLKVPSGYKFIQNPNATDYDLGVYDDVKQVYIFADTYEAYNEEDPFLNFVEEDRVEFSTSLAATYSSNIEESKINDQTVYSYILHYTDTENDTEYYLKVNWIVTENGTYNIDIECELEDYSQYKEDMSEILNSFKELD